MKRFIVAFTFIASLFAAAGNKSTLKTKAATEEFTNPNNYVVLGAEYTEAIWITKDNQERPQDHQKRNAIIFFNSNPKFEIAYINRINYRITSGTKSIDGSVVHNKNYSATYYTERWWSIWPKVMDFYYTSYSYENGAFKTDYERKQQGDSENLVFAGYPHRIKMNFPEMGKTSIIKQTFNKLGELNHEIPERLLWQYKTSEKGFKHYNDFNNWTGNKNYEYYLILPMETAADVTVDYLSLEAYDIHGNKITDKIEIDEVEDFEIPDGTGNEEDPTRLEDVYKFSFIKEDGLLKDNSAVYFPGSNKFQLVGFQMTNYEAEDEGKKLPVYVFAGDLVGKKTIELADAVSKEWKFTYSETEMRHINYKFLGRNNSILIDIPLEVTDVQIDVYFQKININENEELNPFYFNLDDGNGNYGIRGATPIDDDPDKDKDAWWKDIFSFFTDGDDIFGQLKSAVTALLIITVIVLFGVIIFRIIRLRK